MREYRKQPNHWIRHVSAAIRVAVQSFIPKRQTPVDGYHSQMPFPSNTCTRTRLCRVLGLCPRAACVRAVRVARELDQGGGGQLQDLLEAPADGHENLLALVVGAALAAGHIAIAAAGNALADGPRPDTNAVEGLADVDDDTHHLAVVLIFKRLADSAHHHLKPEAVDVDALLVLVLVRPLAAVLVLGVLPLGSDAGLEQMVVGLLRERRDGGDIVLKMEMLAAAGRLIGPKTHVDSPELLDRVKGDDLLQQVVPVVALLTSVSQVHGDEMRIPDAPSRWEAW